MAGEADAADPTELAGVAEMQTEAAHAWSLDDADEDYPLTGSWQDPDRRLTPRRVTILAVAVSIAAVGAVGGFGAWKLRDQGPDVQTTHVVVATATTAAVATVPPPPPPTPRSTAKAIAPKVPPSPATFDSALIRNLRHLGWTVGDEANLITNGHLACEMLQRGASPASVIARMENGSPPFTPADARSFLTTVMTTYPNCP